MRTLLMCLGVFLALSPTLCIAVEFSDGDVLPQATQLEFDRDKLYFHVYNHDAKLVAEWYSFDRKTHELKALTAAPAGPELKVPPPAMGGNRPIEIVTSDGYGFISGMPDCEEGGSDTGTLQDEKTGVQIPLTGMFETCTGPGSIESFGGRLLVGAYAMGDYANAAEPVVVLDAKTHALLGSFKFAADVIRSDPYYPQVWLIGVDGLVLLDADLKLRQRWYFYQGFRPGDHRLALLASDTPRKTEALAVIGVALNLPDQDAWYKAVMALPQPAREGFSLYTFYMNGPGVIYGYQPKELNTLVPFFIQAFSRAGSKLEAIGVLNNLCRFDDSRATDFIQTLAVAGGPFVQNATTCLQAHTVPHPIARETD